MEGSAEAFSSACDLATETQLPNAAQYVHSAMLISN